MQDTLRPRLSQFLEYVAQALDIPDSYYEQAVGHYGAVCKWLGEEDSPLAGFHPILHPQGSFELGTVTRPINDEDEYDLDLVCKLTLSKDDVTQKQLKQMIGDRLRDNEIYRQMLDREERRRCWRLNYADSAQFHMDICPAIPEDESFKQQLCALGVAVDLATQAVAITDKKHYGYGTYTNDWPCSNPAGYADWFRNRMKTRMDEQRLRLAAQYEGKIEQVPFYKIKTPLQRSIQILKRHRDMMFEHDQDDKPVSMIITTLAALAYDNEADLLDALTKIVDKMPDHIERHSGEYRVLNPVNPAENFADKWTEYPQREEKFKAWLRQVRQDINLALQNEDLQTAGAALKMRFGERAVKESLDRFSTAAPPARFGSSAPRLAGVLQAAHRERPRWPMRLSSSISVEGRFRHNDQWQWFRSDGHPLPKHCRLQFQAETNVQGIFSVYWQVVNTGLQAEQVNGLRGQIFPASSLGRGGLTQCENTLYTGTHFIECFVIQDGECVARSGEFIVNIQ